MLSDNHRRQNRQRVQLALVLALLGIVLGAGISYGHSRAIATEGDKLRASARAVDENLGRQLDALHASLTSVREDLPFFAKGNYQEGLFRRLSALSAALPGVRTILVVNADGKIIASNKPDTVGATVAARPYYQQLKVQADAAAMYLSEPFTTTSGIFSLNAIKAVFNSAGRFDGLIAATLEPEHFSVLLNSLLYAPDMRATLVHGNGRIFMSVPLSQATLGKDLAVPGSNFSVHRATGLAESMTSGPTYSLGERRLTAWRNIQPAAAKLNTPLVLAVGREFNAVLAPWRLFALLFGTAYCLLCALAIFSLLYFQRRQRVDVVARHTLEEANRRSAERVSLAMAGASLGLWDVDIPSGRAEVNARYYRMLGYSDAQGFTSMPELLAKIHPDDLNAVEEAFTAARHSRDGAFNMELRMRHRDGHWIWIHSIGKITERDADGNAVRATGTHLDISDRKATEAQIWDLAFFDPLTKLPNRRLLLDRIAQACTASARSGQTAAVLFVDLDRFKELNDTRGHAAGDALLCEAATRLTECIRQSDTVARLGGDEFVLLLQNLDGQRSVGRTQAQTVAEKTLRALGQPYQLPEGEYSLSGSIGATLFMGHDSSGEQILEQADQAMYQAKRAGRNAVVFYEIPLTSY